LTTLTQPAAAAAGADERRPLVVVVAAAAVDTVALMSAARGRVRVAEVPTVADACARVVGVDDVATATCDADRLAPIALGRATSRPTRLTAQATIVTCHPDNRGRNPRRRARLPAPPRAAT
jgi:hypothetical protein